MVELEVWGNGCECWVTPATFWTVHYGAVEPGSMIEWNPDCPLHGEAAPRVAKELNTLIVLPYHSFTEQA